MRVGMFNISPKHYNDIPIDILQGEKTILEFGCASGLNQLICKHRDFFIENNKEGRYLGIDLELYEEQYFNIEQGDIRDYQADQQYDVVIALHVLEHIEIEYWQEVFERLVSMVASDGVLIIGTPHDEPVGTHEGHLVFGITPELVQRYLLKAEVRLIRNEYPFSEDGVSFVWALLRYIKRWVTGHPFVRPHSRLLAIWRNNTKETEQ